MHEPLTRFPKNPPGDFYTTGYCVDGQWSGDCLNCELPETQAPLVDTYFLKQPENDEELSQAIAAANVCCVEAVRYGGKDKRIIRRVDPGASDFKISIVGTVVPSENPWWKLW